MKLLKLLMLRVDGALAMLALILTPASAALADNPYIPAPPIAVPIERQQRDPRAFGDPRLIGFAPGTRVSVAPTTTPRFVGSPSFFPKRPSNADIRFRTGVLIGFGAGMHSGGAAIRDNLGQVYSYFTGWPMYIEGKQTRCAVPPRPGVRFDPILCNGGWPADIVFGVTRVRVYYWHDVTPWGQHVEVTDQIIRVP